MNSENVNLLIKV